jgi:hypothetical protein
MFGVCQGRNKYIPFGDISVLKTKTLYFLPKEEKKEKKGTQSLVKTKGNDISKGDVDYSVINIVIYILYKL